MKTTTLAIAMLVMPLAAEAKPKPKSAAKPHIEKATKAHKAGNFQLALDELETAYAIDPQPKLLYAIAQTHAKLDNCPQAITYYEKYLATITDKAKQEVVKQAISSCKGKAAAAPPAEDKDAVFRKHKDEPAAEEPKPEPEPAEPVKAPPPPEPAKPPEPAPPPAPVAKEPAAAPLVQEPVVVHHRSHWYSDVLGDALVIAGVGAGVGGAILYSSAVSDLDAAEKSSSLMGYQDLVDSAHQKRTYTIILGGGGLALVAAGILRYATRDTGESHAVAIVPTSGGGLITLSGGF